MARKKGIPKYVIVSLAVIFITAGIIIGLPYIDNTINFTNLFSEAGILTSNVEFFSLPSTPQLTLTPIGYTIDCKIYFTTVARNTLGQVIATINSVPNTSPVYINLNLLKRGGTTGTPSDTIFDYVMTPKLSCDNKVVSGGNIGYFLPNQKTIKYSASFKNPTGSLVYGSACIIPSFSYGDLGDNIERTLPSCTIHASDIDSQAPPFSSKYDSEVQISMAGEIDLQQTATTASGATISGALYKYFIGEKTTQITTHLITIDKVNAPPVAGIQTISILRLDRASDGVDLLGLQNKINSNDLDPLKATVKTTALLSGFRDSNLQERFPVIKMFECLDSTCNTNRLIGTATDVKRVLTSDIFEGNIEVPTGASAGHYAMQVTSPDRSQVASRGFMVEQTALACPSGYTGTQPSCSKIVTPTPTPTPTPTTTTTCPTDATILSQSKTKTDSQLLQEVTVLKGKLDQGLTLSPCENSTYNYDSQELKTRNVSTTPTPTTPLTGLGGSKAKIEYISHFASTDTTTNRPCQVLGDIPKEGVEITPFQLISSSGTCGGNQFTDFELRPVMDFGSNKVTVDKTSFKLDVKMWISLNNNFPATPTFDVTACEITTNTPPTDCKITDFDFTKDTKSILFAQGEVSQVTSFRSSTPTIYDIIYIKQDAGQLEQKLKSAGFTPKDGDNYSVLIQVLGTFKGTKDGTAFNGKIPATAYTQSFSYKAIESSCDLTVSFEQPTTTVLPNGQEQTTVQCVARDTNTCPTAGEIFDPVSKTCSAKPDPSCNGIQIKNDAGVCVDPPEPKICVGADLPTCQSDEKYSETGRFDICGFAILECIPKATEEMGCPANQIKNPQTLICEPEKPVTVEKTPSGGCPPEYELNEFGVCQLIGSGTHGKEPPNGGQITNDYCKSDANFDFGKCFTQVFGGSNKLQATGITSDILIVVVLIAVLLIVVAIVIRIRRGSGYKI